MGKFRKLFRQLPDPRAANARHDLLEVLFIALAAVLCGAESCSDMADFGQSKEGLLRLFLRLEHGVPSHDTFTGCSVCSNRKPSNSPSGNLWRALPRGVAPRLPGCGRSAANARPEPS